MNLANKRFKKWCLPRNDTGVMAPRANDVDHLDPINAIKKTVAIAAQEFNNTPTEEKRQAFEFVLQRLMIYRANSYFAVLGGVNITRKEKEEEDEDEQAEDEDEQAEDEDEQAEDEDEQAEDEDEQAEDMSIPEEYPLWDGSKAGTMVSHMIFSRKNNEQERKLDHAPLQYILQDPRTGLSVNLVEVFRGAETPDRYHDVLRMIWDHIKEWMELDGGEFLSETLTTRDGSGISEAGQYVKEHMIKLKHAMSSAVEHGADLDHRLGVQYRGDRWRALNLLYNGGEVKLQVSDGIPDVGDLNPFAFPEKVTKIVNAAWQRWKDASPGLFVSIIWKSMDGEQGEHYLYLSEYQHSKLNATLASGFEDEWMQSITNTDKWPAFTEKQVAIPKCKVPSRSPQEEAADRLHSRDRKTWDIPNPWSEARINRFLIDYTTNKLSSDEMEQIIDSMDNETDMDERDVDEEKVEFKDLIKPYFFSGDNMAFLVVFFNTEYDCIRRLVGLKINDIRKGWFVQVLAVRYPVLYINIDKTMIDIRYKYFQRNTTDISKWSLWRDGKWHIPHRRSWEDPDRFQTIPTDNDPLDMVHMSDGQGKTVYPLRKLVFLPPNTTFEFLKIRRRYMSPSFYVNNLEQDANVVYNYATENTATWNDIQLFRLNAEVQISRMGHVQYGMSFYQFRREKIRPGSRDFPFKLYLAEYPALQPEWRKLWEAKWPQLEGWTRVRDDESSSEEGGQAQPAPRHIPHEQRGPGPARGGARGGGGRRRGWTQAVIKAAREASQRRQNEKGLISMLYNRGLN